MMVVEFAQFSFLTAEVTDTEVKPWHIPRGNVLVSASTTKQIVTEDTWQSLVTVCSHRVHLVCVQYRSICAFCECLLCKYHLLWYYSHLRMCMRNSAATECSSATVWLSVWVHYSLRGVSETINSWRQDTFTGNIFFLMTARLWSHNCTNSWIGSNHETVQFPLNGPKITYSLREVRHLLTCCGFCVSNITWPANVGKAFDDNGGGREQKQDIHVCTLWLFSAFLTLLFSVHVVACVQSNCQSGQGACGWHNNNTGSQHFSARDG